MVAFLGPFRIVEASGTTPWSISIDQVNSRSWDYVALHEIVGGVDVGLNTPYHMAVGRDGSLALPLLPDLRTPDKAVGFFNHCLSALLLGGVYCSAIDLDGIDFGSIINWKYLRIDSSAPANRFQRHCRLLGASLLEAVELMSPRTANLSVLIRAMKNGRDILTTVPELSGEFLLRGTTGIARRDWNLALANLWIVIEQLTSNLWTKHVTTTAKADDRVDGRVDQLQDTRTWSVSTRQELLFQIGILTIDVLRDLSTARRARNALAHTGKGPSEDFAQAALRAALHLLKVASGREIPLSRLDLADHILSDPFGPREEFKIEPQYWMPVPKLPGEEELERLEAAMGSIKAARKG